MIGDDWTEIQSITTGSRINGIKYLDSGIFVASTYLNGEIWRSVDYGASWAKVQRLDTEKYSLCIESLGEGICLAGSGGYDLRYPSYGGQIYKSTDYGATWVLAQRLITPYPGYATDVNCIEHLGGGVCLAGTVAGHIFKSTDYGSTWSLAQRLTDQIYSLKYLGGVRCIAGTSGGLVYYSEDSGDSWTLSQRLGSEDFVLSLENLSSGVCVAGTSPLGQIYRSEDYGETWAFVQRLGANTYVYSLANVNGNICLAGTGSSGAFYRSEDNGASWSAVYTISGGSHNYSLEFVSGDLCFAGCRTRFFQTGSFVSPPVAAFSGTPLSGHAVLSVQFTDGSTNTPTSWDWNFGDSTAHSTLQSPQHSYSRSGIFTVTLTATNAAGSDSEEKTDYVEVIALAPPGPDPWPPSPVGKLSNQVDGAISYQLNSSTSNEDVGSQYQHLMALMKSTNYRLRTKP